MVRPAWIDRYRDALRHISAFFDDQRFVDVKIDHVLIFEGPIVPAERPRARA